MSVGIFIDKNHQPTEAEVNEAVGTRLLLWHELITYIRDKYPCQEDFKFLYGKNYGWARRFRINGQLLISLYPSSSGFTAQVNLSPEAIEQVQKMNPGMNVQKAIAQAFPYPEGRWLFIPVETTNDLVDIKPLLELRVKAKRMLKSP